MNFCKRGFAFIALTGWSVAAVASNYRCTLEQDLGANKAIFLQMNFETSLITGMIKRADFSYRSVQGNATSQSAGEMQCKHSFTDAKCVPNEADAIIEFFHLSRKGVESKFRGIDALTFMKCEELRDHCARK